MNLILEFMNDLITTQRNIAINDEIKKTMQKAHNKLEALKSVIPNKEAVMQAQSQKPSNLDLPKKHKQCISTGTQVTNASLQKIETIKTGWDQISSKSEEGVNKNVISPIIPKSIEHTNGWDHFSKKTEPVIIKSSQNTSVVSSSGRRKTIGHKLQECANKLSMLNKIDVYLGNICQRINDYATQYMSLEECYVHGPNFKEFDRLLEGGFSNYYEKVRNDEDLNAIQSYLCK